jgi:hypothetical protein
MIHYDSYDDSEGIAMKQLSLRGFDPELEKRIREMAKKEGISLNRATLRLLRNGAGLDDTGRAESIVGNSLDHLIGKWSSKEEKEFLRSIEPLEQIDRSFWK